LLAQCRQPRRLWRLGLQRLIAHARPVGNRARGLGLAWAIARRGGMAYAGEIGIAPGPTRIGSEAAGVGGDC
jgi:hypothetical protein